MTGSSNGHERRNAYAREWRKRHKERINAEQRVRYLGDKAKYHELARNSKLRTVYGITPLEYDELSDSQGGVCAICQQAESVRHQSGRVRRLAVDHDHDAGRVRGLLCYRCNTVLGQYEVRREAIDAYLARYA